MAVWGWSMNMKNRSQNNEQNLERNFSLISESDVIEIRKYGRNLAKKSGFKIIDQTLIAAAISEICRNVIEYAERGEVSLLTEQHEQTCLKIIVKDKGPGIADIEKALKEGFSSGEGLGIGLSGTKRLMDEFNIKSAPGEGTTVEMCKYLNN